MAANWPVVKNIQEVQYIDKYKFMHRPKNILELPGEKGLIAYKGKTNRRLNSYSSSGIPSRALEKKMST